MRVVPNTGLHGNRTSAVPSQLVEIGCKAVPHCAPARLVAQRDVMRADVVIGHVGLQRLVGRGGWLEAVDFGRREPAAQRQGHQPDMGTDIDNALDTQAWQVGLHVGEDIEAPRQLSVYANAEHHLDDRLCAVANGAKPTHDALQMRPGGTPTAPRDVDAAPHVAQL